MEALEEQCEAAVLGKEEAEGERDTMEEQKLELEIEMEGVKDELEAARAEAQEARAAAAAAAASARSGASAGRAAPGTPSGAGPRGGPSTPATPAAPASGQALFSPAAKTPDSMAAQNARLRMALQRLRDQSREDVQALREKLKSARERADEAEAAEAEAQELRAALEEAQADLAEAQETADAGSAWEEMLEKMSARGMELSEQLDKARAEAQELEQLVQVGDELCAEQEESERRMEKQLRAAKQRLIELGKARAREQEESRRAREQESKLGAALRASQRETARANAALRAATATGAAGRSRAAAAAGQAEAAARRRARLAGALARARAALVLEQSRSARKDAAAGAAFALVPRAVWAPFSEVSQAVALSLSAGRLLRGVLEAGARAGQGAALVAAALAREMEGVLAASAGSSRPSSSSTSTKRRTRAARAKALRGKGSQGSGSGGGGEGQALALALMESAGPRLLEWGEESGAGAGTGGSLIGMLECEAACTRAGDLAGARAAAAGCARSVWLVHCMLVGVHSVGAGAGAGSRAGSGGIGEDSDEEDEVEDPRAVDTGASGGSQQRKERAARRAWGLAVEAALGGFAGVHQRLGGAAQQQLLDAADGEERERVLARSVGHVLAARAGPVLGRMVQALESSLQWAEGADSTAREQQGAPAAGSGGGGNHTEIKAGSLQALAWGGEEEALGEGSGSGAAGASTSGSDPVRAAVQCSHELDALLADGHRARGPGGACVGLGTSLGSQDRGAGEEQDGEDEGDGGIDAQARRHAEAQLRGWLQGRHEEGPASPRVELLRAWELQEQVLAAAEAGVAGAVCGAARLLGDAELQLGGLSAGYSADAGESGGSGDEDEDDDGDGDGENGEGKGGKKAAAKVGKDASRLQTRVQAHIEALRRAGAVREAASGLGNIAVARGKGALSVGTAPSGQGGVQGAAGGGIVLLRDSCDLMWAHGAAVPSAGLLLQAGEEGQGGARASGAGPALEAGTKSALLFLRCSALHPSAVSCALEAAVAAA